MGSVKLVRSRDFSNQHEGGRSIGADLVAECFHSNSLEGVWSQTLLGRFSVGKACVALHKDELGQIKSHSSRLRENAGNS